MDDRAIEFIGQRLTFQLLTGTATECPLTEVKKINNEWIKNQNRQGDQEAQLRGIMDGGSLF
jgi:hypothetical protein